MGFRLTALGGWLSALSALPQVREVAEPIVAYSRKTKRRTSKPPDLELNLRALYQVRSWSAHSFQHSSPQESCDVTLAKRSGFEYRFDVKVWHRTDKHPGTADQCTFWSRETTTTQPIGL